jgi:glycosyltransferase involved in cell wall biosynthesis
MVRGAPEVLFVGHGAERSGPPVYLRNLQRWLAAHTDLDLATVLARGGPLVDELAGPVRVVERPWAPSRLTQRWAPAQALADRAALRGWADAPVVYVNTMAPPTLRLLAHVDPSALVVAHVHELEAALRYGLDDEARRRFRERPDRYVAASRAVADNLVANHGVAEEQIAVHHEFVEPVAPPEDRSAARRARGIPEDAFVVGGSGMLEWRKAPELFVRLAADLRSRTGRELSFVWVGGADRGPLWAPLDHEARHLGVDDVVRFVGAQADPGSWFGLLDAFVLTSREDAFPLAALEAGSAGVPVLTFATGGMVELVDPGSVVPYPDTEALADLLAALAADEAARSALGADVADRVRARHLTDVAAPALWADLSGWLGR